MGSVYQAAYDAAGDMTCRAPTSSQTCAGNPSSFTGQQLGYDNEGRLTTWANSYTVPTASDTFLYDGEGNRIEQVVQTTSSKTDTVYVGKLEQVTITTPTGGQPTTSTLAYYGGVAVAVNGVLSYLGSDQLGSAEVALDSNGNVIASQLFTPYGNTRYSSGVFPTQQAFTGYLADSATGLDYANARYYDPAAGAFISADATGGSGLNRYAYAGDNPETFTDPSGLIITCANGCPLSGSLQDPQYRMFVIALALSNELEPGTGMPYLLYFKIYEPQVYSIVHAYAEQHGIDLDMYAAYQAIKFRASKPESYWKDHPEEYYAVTTAGIGVAILQTGSAGNGSLNQLYGSVEYDDAFVELPDELNVDEGVIDENPDDSSPLLKRPEESSGGNGDTGGDNGGGGEGGEGHAGHVEFAHGTAPSSARDIVDNGLNAAKATAAASKGAFSRPGSFFALNMSDYGSAAKWCIRQVHATDGLRAMPGWRRGWWRRWRPQTNGCLCACQYAVAAVIA